MENQYVLETLDRVEEGINVDGSTYWSGFTAGLEQSAGWLFNGSTATAAQYTALGDSLLNRAADYASRLQGLAEGIGNPVERASLIESAQRISTYIESTRAGGAEAIASAGEAAARAGRQAMLGALGRVGGPAVDAYQYVSNLHGAIVDDKWDKFGATAAGLGTGAAMGYAMGVAAIGALAMLASVIAVPAGVGAALIFSASFLGAFGGSAFGPLIYSGLKGLSELIFSAFTTAAAARPAPIYRDPLAIDLDGDGIETVGIGSSPVTFDHNADGVRTGTGWVSGDDAWLVFDRNGNGSIDSGRELFGVDTLKSNGQRATSGLDALRDLDSNADGVFSANDAAFAQVRLWRDANQDGISQASELTSLSGQGIASIRLAGTAANTSLGNGNTVGATSVVTRADGTTTTASDLNVAHNPFFRSFASEVAVTAAAQALPQMGGSGWVRDLREAMSLDTEQAQALITQVQAFATGSTKAEQMDQLDGLIRAWAASNQTVALASVDDPLRRFVVSGNPELSARLQAIVPVLEIFNALSVTQAGMHAPTLSTLTAADGSTQQVQTYTLFAEQVQPMLNAHEQLRQSVYGALLLIEERGIWFDGEARASNLSEWCICA